MIAIEPNAVVDYAKAAPDDLVIRISAQSRPGTGPTAPAADPVVPQHLRRGEESWRPELRVDPPPSPAPAWAEEPAREPRIHAFPPRLGDYWLACQGVPAVADLIKAEAVYPGWLGRLLTTPIMGPERYEEMLRQLTGNRAAIKVYGEVAREERA